MTLETDFIERRAHALRCQSDDLEPRIRVLEEMLLAAPAGRRKRHAEIRGALLPLVKRQLRLLQLAITLHGADA